ncbi:heat shock protein 70 [Aphelenchoides avenae]|nr:heat shock protein 70 [Aphelenchus avenae]
MDAARIAKLNVLQLPHEPTAAAIAYGLKWATDERRNVLVYDFGGGTFDVTVLEMKKGEFTVKSVAGDTHLGGDDIDRCVVDWFVTRCENETGVDITANLKAFNRLKEQSKKAKELLTNADEARQVARD